MGVASLLPLTRSENYSCVGRDEFNRSFLDFLDRVQVCPDQQVEGVGRLHLGEKESDAIFFQVVDVVLVGGHKHQLGSLLIQWGWNLAGVDVVKQVLENVWLDVFYHDFSRLLLLHVVLKHCGKNGTSGCQDGSVPANVKTSFEIELDIAARLSNEQVRHMFDDIHFTVTSIGNVT